jgi:hypothetical protein
MPARIQCQRTAPIGPATVTVNGDHWPAKWAWAGLHFEDAHLRSRSPWCNDDYHLGVPWMHPDDYDVMHDDPDCWATYRVRPKRGWRSFVRIDGVWHVSSEPEKQMPPFGTPPWQQVTVVDVVLSAEPPDA